MVGDDPVRHRMRAVRRHPRGLGRSQDQGPEQVDIVIVVLALQDRGDAFEPHAGVDRRARQGGALARAELLVLHKDEVPDLDEPVAVRVGAARRAARDRRPVIPENFRTRPAWPDIAHRPEIVRGGDAE